jgi:hypothetical protein
MIPTKLLFLSPAVLLAACISLPEVEGPKAEVRLITPSETAYTNGTLALQLEVTGTPPDNVELLLDDAQVLAELTPPYTFQWDTTSVPEGQHYITGRAYVAGKVFTSAAREVVVDRTPPQLASRIAHAAPRCTRCLGPAAHPSRVFGACDGHHSH